MNFFKFLKDHLSHMAAFIIGMIFLNLIIWIDSGLQSRLSSLLYLDLLGLVFMFGFFVLLYWSRKKFYQELNYRTIHPEKSYEESLNLAQNNTNEMYQDAYNSLIRYNREITNDLVEKISDQQDFITKWIHEIKVPIAALQLLIESTSDLIPAEKVTQMKEELKKTDHLVEQVLYYSRLDDFANDYLIQKYSLKNLVKDVIIENMNYLLAKKIQFTLDGEDVEVLTDDKWLKFILDQLVSNAIKYSPEESKLKISIIHSNQQVKLTIKDKGIGIPAADINRIFEKGFTGENGRRQQTKSTGLGLYLAKEMSQKLGHELSVSSVQNEGSTFTLTFPYLSYYNSSKTEDNLAINKKD